MCLFYFICTGSRIFNPSLLGVLAGPPDMGPKPYGAPVVCFFLPPECGPPCFPSCTQSKRTRNRIWQPSASLYHNSACFSSNKRHLPLSRHLCFDSLSLHEGLPTRFPTIPGVWACTCVCPAIVVFSLLLLAFYRRARGSPEPQVLGRRGREKVSDPKSKQKINHIIKKASFYQAGRWLVLFKNVIRLLLAAIPYLYFSWPKSFQKQPVRS